MGIACADAFRLEPGMFWTEVSFSFSEEDVVVVVVVIEGLKGKKHLKIPSACHFVACVKLTQTSIRPGLLRAGSRRSI